MTPSVVLAAARPGSSSAAVRPAIGIATVNDRCTILCAPLADKRRRCLLSLEKVGRYTAVTVTLKLDARLKTRLGNTENDRGGQVESLLYHFLLTALVASPGISAKLPWLKSPPQADLSNAEAADSHLLFYRQNSLYYLGIPGAAA